MDAAGKLKKRLCYRVDGRSAPSTLSMHGSFGDCTGGSTTTSPLCPLPIAHRRSEGVSLFCLGHFSTRKTRMGGTNVRQVRPPIHAITAFGCLVRSAEGESGVADCCGSPEGSPLAGILRMQDITGYIFVRKDGDCATGFRAAVVRQLAYLAWSWKWV